jgi:hypothetical protein
LITTDGRQFDNTSKLRVDVPKASVVSAKPAAKDGVSTIKTAAASTQAGWKRSAMAEHFESPAQPLLPE